MAAKNRAAFLKWLDEWFAGLKDFNLKREVQDPACAAVCSEDLINGFCYEGNLASPRLQAIVEPIVKIFKDTYTLGVRNYVLVQDSHTEHAAEFKSFPPHCIRGTSESQTVSALRALPFSSEFFIIKKNSLHPAIDTELNRWLENHQDLDTFIVVGDCTDLCTYHLALYIKLRANARDWTRRVIVPANAVDTYDLSVASASKTGAMPHDADLMHELFLYHMALNGIQVVKAIT